MRGLILCAKYAVAPNFFGYCGPDDNKNIVDHLVEKYKDEELVYLLKEFGTLYPYLQLIARQNQINNPFNHSVIEAYWIGNSLLKAVNAFEYQAFSKEKLILDKKLSKIDFQNLLCNITKKPFLPHHAFHVFNVFRRTNHNLSFHILKTMDECRIGWGRIKNKNEKLKIKNLIVETKLLTKTGDKLKLGQPVLKEIKVDYQGKQFINSFKVGDWVSFHWGFFCDILTDQQVKNLEFYTQKAIDFFNS